AEEDTRRLKQARRRNIALSGPAGRAIGSHMLGLAGTPQRAQNRNTASDKSACPRDSARLIEYRRSVGIISVPPNEQRPHGIDPYTEHDKPGRAQLRLEGKLPGRPLGGE